jgi:hypothetical protein
VYAVFCFLACGEFSKLYILVGNGNKSVTSACSYIIRIYPLFCSQFAAGINHYPEPYIDAESDDTWKVNFAHETIQQP